MGTRLNAAGFDARRALEAPAHDACSASTPRVAIYLRVSTGRQAEHDLSIPDQRAQTHAWVAQRGWCVVAEYVEPGASATDRPAVDVSPIVIERFGQAMRERLTTGEVPFRKAYLGSIVDRVEVDDGEIRIVGRKDVLEQAVLANGAPVPGVRSFVRNWRTVQDETANTYVVVIAIET